MCNSNIKQCFLNELFGFVTAVLISVEWPRNVVLFLNDVFQRFNIANVNKALRDLNNYF